MSNEQRIAVRGGHVVADVEGEGSALLLLRPLGGSRALWGTFRDELARSFRTVAFDPRGVGASSAPGAFVTTREMARDAIAVLDALGVARTHVFGISLGGMVATWLAADQPSRVERLVLASTMPWGLTVRHASPIRALSLARCLARSGPDCDACLARRVLSPGFRRTHPEEVARIDRAVRENPADRRALMVLLGAAARHDAKPALARITAPTLVLAGTRDHLAAPSSQRWLADALHARFSTLDSGHDLTLEAPVETASVVTAFLRGPSTTQYK